MRALLPVYLLLASLVLTGVSIAQIQWEPPDGVEIRQGVHLEWSRSAVADGSGGLIVTWSDTRAGDRDLYAQLFDANGDPQWGGGGITVCAVAGRQEDPVIVTDGAGGGIIAWVDFRDGIEDVYAQRVTYDGAIAWAPEGIALCTAQNIQTSLRSSDDGSGGMIVAWQDFRDDASGDIYAQRILGDATIVWDPDGVPVSEADGGQTAHTVDGDELGGAIIAWSDDRFVDVGRDIYAQRIRADGSAAWTVDGEPVCDTGGGQEEPRLVRDSAHGAFVVWRDRRDDYNGDIYGQRIDSTGVGLWPIFGDADGIQICTVENSAQSLPRIINDGEGGAITIWLDDRAAVFDEDVYAQRLSSTGERSWKVAGPDSLQGVPVCDESGRQLEARVVTDGLGGAVVAWADHRDGTPNRDIYAQRMDSLGTAVWTPNGVEVGTAAGAQDQPLLEQVAPGATAIIWGDEREGSLAIYAQKVDLSGSDLWPEDGIIVHGGPAGNALHTDMVEGPDGGALICWDDSRLGVGGARVYGQYVDTSGLTHWAGNGAALCPDGIGNQTEPAAAPNGEGGMVVAWVDRRGAYKQIYAQNADSGAGLLWGAAGVALASTANDQEGVAIASVGDTAFVCVWADLRGGSFDVYGQRLDPLGAVEWGAGGVGISAVALEDEDPAGVIDDGSGGVLVVWQGGSWDDHNIYLQRLDSGGSVEAGWPPDGLTVCEATGNQDNPQMVGDGAGGALIVWEDLRGSDNDLYAQHVNADGTIDWKVAGPDSLNGIPVVAEANDQTSPSMIPDGGGGFIVAWQDFRSGSNNDIYAQWIDGSGSPLWDAGGVAVASLSENDQSKPFLTGAPGGGIVVLWEDYRGGVWSDIYAQALSDTGTAIWEADGILVCGAVMDQSDPIAIGDALTGAICLWEDMRSSGKTELHDLYAQRLIETGVLVIDQGLDENETHALSLGQSFPNPFRHSAAIAYTVPFGDGGEGAAEGSRGAGVRVSLRVYNIQGQLVKTLVDAPQSPGRYRVEWNGEDDRGNELAAGVYFLRLEAGAEALNRKMILVR